MPKWDTRCYNIIVDFLDGTAGGHAGENKEATSGAATSDMRRGGVLVRYLPRIDYGITYPTQLGVTPVSVDPCQLAEALR